MPPIPTAPANVYTGAYGTLGIGANEPEPEGKHAVAVITAYNLHTVGRVLDVTLRVDTNLEEFHELGRRHPVSLHPGNIHISGTVGRAYVNGALLFLLLGRGALIRQVQEPYLQPKFNMQLTLEDPAFPGTSALIGLAGVKFENWALALPEDDFVLENLAFKALNVFAVDEQAPAGGGQPTEIIPQFQDATTTQ
jgi:hypothetical protein